MGRIRLTRISYGSGKNKSKTIRIHNNKTKQKGNQNRCPSCGRYM